MNFLSPSTIAIAAALTIPPLIALYFLKLRRAVRVVPSTMLWRKAVEDLQVNAPFQKLRKSLLLLLQLLVLALAAVALGKPMFETAENTEETVLLLVDQSASMAVNEPEGKTRLHLAKEQAVRTLDGLADNARVMVIAFCDRATVVSSFDTDKSAVRRKIDSIEQTDSTTTLTEAIGLAEAYAQNLIIGTDQPGTDIAPERMVAPATVYLFTDGRVADADRVTIEKFDMSKIRVIPIGQRADNVGIVAMAASRDYEQPGFLEVTATIENLSPEAKIVDATLYIDGRNVDVQTVRLESSAPAKGEFRGVEQPIRAAESPLSLPGRGAGGEGEDAGTPTTLSANRTFGHVQVAAFDQINFEGSGVVEVVLQIDDALPADDRAWSVIDPPRRSRVLLVTPGNLFLEGVLQTLSIEPVIMTPDQYEAAPDTELVAEDRSSFDVVIFDRYSTARLPHGNYVFWAAAPKIEGVIETRRVVDDEIIFDWDEAHPVLRHVAVETVDPLTWIELKLPPEAVNIIDGQRTPVMAYLARDASQYLINAFSVIGQDDEGNLYRNGNWVASIDFVVLVQNMVQYMAASISVRGKRGVSPGEPVTIPIPARVEEVEILRPDNIIDRVPSGGGQSVHYARTREVGVYRVNPAMPRYEVFAVNLYNASESNVAPVGQLTLGATTVEARAGEIKVNKPAWPYFLLGVLGLLLLEWIVYNQRVFV